MLKVLAAVLAVLSAIISITLYSTTIPAVQKQAADNAAAIETLNNEVNDIPTPKKYYNHCILFSSADIKINIINSSSTQFNNNSLAEYINNHGDIYINKFSITEIPQKTLSVTSYITASGSSLKIVGYNANISYDGSTYSYNVNKSESSIFSSITDTVTEL